MGAMKQLYTEKVESYLLLAGLEPHTLAQKQAILSEMNAIRDELGDSFDPDDYEEYCY